MDRRLRELQRQAQNDPSARAQYWRALLQSSTIPLWYIQALGIMGDPIAEEIAPYEAIPGAGRRDPWGQVINVITESPVRGDLYAFTIYYLDHLNQAWCDAYPEYGLRYDDDNSGCIDYLASLNRNNIPEMAKLAAQITLIITSFRDRMNRLQVGGAVIDCADLIEIDLLDIIYSLLRSADPNTGYPLMGYWRLYELLDAFVESNHAENFLMLDSEGRLSGQLLLPYEDEDSLFPDNVACEFALPKYNATWVQILSRILENHSDTVGVFDESNRGVRSKILATSREFNFDVARNYVNQAIANSH